MEPFFSFYSKTALLQELLGGLDCSVDSDSTNIADASQQPSAEAPPTVSSQRRRQSQQRAILHADVPHENPQCIIASDRQTRAVPEEPEQADMACLQELGQTSPALSELDLDSARRESRAAAGAGESADTHPPAIMHDHAGAVAAVPVYKAFAGIPSVLASTMAGIVTLEDPARGVAAAVSALAQLAAASGKCLVATTALVDLDQSAAAVHEPSKATKKSMAGLNTAGSKVRSKSKGRRTEVQGVQAARDHRKLQHAAAASAVAPLLNPTQPVVVPFGSSACEEAHVAVSASRVGSVPSRTHGVSKGFADFSSAAATSTSHGPATALRPAAVAPRAAAVAPGSLSANATGTVPKAGARASSLSPRPQSASPRAARGAAAPSKRAFVSAIRSGQILQPSRSRRQRPHSAHTAARTSSAATAATVLSPDSLLSIQQPHALADCQAVMVHRSDEPDPYICDSHLSDPAGKDTVSEPQHRQSSADHRQSSADHHQTAADHHQLEVLTQPATSHPLPLPSPTAVQALDLEVSEYDPKSGSDSPSHSADLSVDSSQSASSQLESGGETRQVASAWDLFAQQPDSVGSIARMFMMRQRAQMVIQVSIQEHHTHLLLLAANVSIVTPYLIHSTLLVTHTDLASLSICQLYDFCQVVILWWLAVIGGPCVICLPCMTVRT